MTPREPDRFEAKAETLLFDMGLNVEMVEFEGDRDRLAAALRQAADEMRQASIDACDDAIGACQGDREVEAVLECIKRIRALASPAAAPAAEDMEPRDVVTGTARETYAGIDFMRGTRPAAAPAAETAQQENRRFSTWTGPTGKQATTEEWLCPDCGGWHVVGLGGIRVGHPCPRTQPPAPPSEPAAPSLLPRVLAALESVGSVPSDAPRVKECRSLAAELRRYIAEMETGHAEAPDAERDRNRHNAMLVEAWREEFGTLCKVLFPGNDGPIGWKHVQAKIAEREKRIAGLERDYRAYAEWATSEFGARAWQPGESYEKWQARAAVRSEGET